MLTELKAYSSLLSAPILLLDENGRAETDLLQVRNIDGLDPVKASVNASALGSGDGVSYVGSSVPSRNIVLTVHPNPDWDAWSYERLRRLLYAYFMPKKPVQLVFYSDDLVPVMIEGIVESAEGNLFSKDPEFVVSIICPDPYFTALDPTILVGEAIRPGGEILEIDYQGSIETGVYVKVGHVSDPSPVSIGIQLGDPDISYFNIDATVTASKYFEMSSIPTQKFVQNVEMGTGIITNLLSKVHVKEGSEWPTILQPGINEFSVITNAGAQEWELRYYERFGGL